MQYGKYGILIFGLQCLSTVRWKKLDLCLVNCDEEQGGTQFTRKFSNSKGTR